MKTVANVLAVVAILGFVATAGADDFSAGGGAISDTGFGCGDPSTTATTFPVISIPGGFDTIASVQLDGLNHTWAGDIDIQLDGPGGYNTFLVDRPGTDGAACGSAADYVSNNTYNWANGGSLISEAPSDPIPSGGYAPTGEFGAASTALPTGAAIAGDWTLSIRDWSGGDSGSISGWTIEATPEPSTLGLLAIGGLALLRRRR